MTFDLQLRPTHTTPSVIQIAMLILNTVLGILYRLFEDTPPMTSVESDMLYRLEGVTSGWWGKQVVDEVHETILGVLL